MEEVYKNQTEILSKQNDELAKELQHFKKISADKENERLELIKEHNDLRLRVTMFKRKYADNARKLDAAIQSAGGEILSHIVQASNIITRLVEHSKSYVQECLDCDSPIPRWNTLSSPPVSEKINVVPPMLIGGQLFQPVVTLNRNLLDNNTRSPGEPSTRTPTGNMPSAVPAHMLQDVYIRLTRIDANLHTNNAETDMEVPDDDNSNRDISEDENESRSSHDGYQPTLEPVFEEDEIEEAQAPQRPIIDPMEGPSWLLDRPFTGNRRNKSFEPDSTTELDEMERSALEEPNSVSREEQNSTLRVPEVTVREFSPTVRRRKCASPPLPATPRLSASPYFSPAVPTRTHSFSNRVLKVLIPKINFDVSPGKRSKKEQDKHKDQKKQTPKNRTDTSPARRLMQFDAPSPNGSTDSRVIVIDDASDPVSPCFSPRLQKIKRNTSNDIENSNTQVNEHNVENRRDKNVRLNQRTENSTISKCGSRPTKRRNTKDSDTQTDFVKKSKNRSKKKSSTSQSTQMTTVNDKLINRENTNSHTLNNPPDQENIDSKSNEVRSEHDNNSRSNTNNNHNNRPEHDNINSRSKQTKTNDNRKRTELDTGGTHSKDNNQPDQEIYEIQSEHNENPNRQLVKSTKNRSNQPKKSSENRNNRSEQSNENFNNQLIQNRENTNNQLEDNQTNRDTSRSTHSSERGNIPENNNPNRSDHGTTSQLKWNERDNDSPENNNTSKDNNHKQSNHRGQCSQQNKYSREQRKESNDSDSDNDCMSMDGRTRRVRKPIVYTEKPLNRKLRR